MGLIERNKNAISLLVFLTISVTINCVSFDITKYGAKHDSDVTQAIANAWKDACAAPTRSKVYIPKGTFKLSKAFFAGPCKNPIGFEIAGTLQAPSKANGFQEGQGWITFEKINQLTIYGGGTFDGNGESSWGQHCKRTQYCSKLPVNIRMNYLNDTVIKSIRSVDSKQFHFAIIGAVNLTFKKVKIIAPKDSWTTDGIHLGRSSNVTITDSVIQTGDDCISIGDGTRDLEITKVVCGPGHGISIGSLGKYENEQPVEGIIVKNCTFKGTSNGVRIKTWQASREGIARDMHFSDLIMDNVETPISIDQEYCPWGVCSQFKGKPSKIKLSDISFKNIKGTCSTPVGIKLVCGGYGCKDVKLSGIDLKYNGKDGKLTSVCKNVKPSVSGYMNPSACSH
ncbi:hypothetical protein CsatB_020145 [Cannabis sativa]